MKLMIEESGLVTDGSKIVFWISDDENKVPLRIQSDLMIGSLRADLVEYEGLRHSFDACAVPQQPCLQFAFFMVSLLCTSTTPPMEHRPSYVMRGVA